MTLRKRLVALLCLPLDERRLKYYSANVVSGTGS